MVPDDPVSVGQDLEGATTMVQGRDVLWASLFKLSRGSGRPLQAQIRQALVGAIRNRRMPAGARVPASRDLARRLGVARNTVVLAYQQLIDEGLLVSRSRSGCFVCDGVPQSTSPAPTGDAEPPDWNRRIVSKPSAERNIAKPRDWQSHPYPFLYGQIDPALFPINAWRECARMALSVLEIRDWARDLIDGDDPELIEQLRVHVLPRRGIWARPDEIIVTLGAQQALYLTAALLVRPGDRVGVEDPGYPDARNIYRRMGAQVVPLPVDDGGLVLSDACAACALISVTPASQCPTTAAMPPDRRRDLLAVARQRDIILVEDDYENAPQGHGSTAALKSLDRDGRVIYVGSLSKVLAPGLRIGYIVAPAPVAQELRALRRLMVRHPPMNNQRAASLFISLGHYEAHLRRLQEGLRTRAGLVKAALARWLPEFEFRLPPGSASAWVQGPDALDTRLLAARAERRGVLIEPGDVFFDSAHAPRTYFRLGFASVGAERIEPGLKTLAEAVRELVPVVEPWPVHEQRA